MSGGKDAGGNGSFSGKISGSQIYDGSITAGGSGFQARFKDTISSCRRQEFQAKMCG